jgi:2,3-bisphosphoglycerate-dependent phosphoglycerate mutase
MKALRVMLACALLTIAGTAAAAEPQIIFLVRHAERAASAPAATTAGQGMTAAPDDPPLSAAGHERAARLAAMLTSANIRYIYATEFLRTRQTAAPTAQARHLETISLPANNSDAIVTQVRQLKGNVLIVGHSNTVPGLLKGLGIKDDITIADSEYDNLFIVVRPETGEPTLIRLKY